MTKLETVQKLLKKNKLCGLLLSSEESRKWFAELNSSAGWILLLENNPILIIDGRYYYGLVNNHPKQIKRIVLATNYYQELEDLIKEHKIKNLGFESEYFTYQQFLNLEQKLKPLKINLVPTLTRKLRIIKTSSEIEDLQKAADIIVDVYKSIQKWITPEKSEKDIANKILALIQEHGGNSPSFPPIVAYNQNSANPHYWASNKEIIKNNGIILIDMGAYFNNFASDMTRVFFIGSREKINPKLFEIYRIVKEAQQIGIDSVKAGVRASTIHKNVYNHIKKYGYEKYFVHRTGHGLGIEVHELPNIAEYDDTILEPNMVVTIEPGIYLPNIGGVRIEDDVVVKEEKSIVLTKNAPKEITFI